VSATSQASIAASIWTRAATATDSVNKNWYQNYAGRGRRYDSGVYSVTWPENGFLFDQAQRQARPYSNCGEAIAGASPAPDKDRARVQLPRAPERPHGRHEPGQAEPERDDRRQRLRARRDRRPDLALVDLEVVRDLRRRG